MHDDEVRQRESEKGLDGIIVNGLDRLFTRPHKIELAEVTIAAKWLKFPAVLCRSSIAPFLAIILSCDGNMHAYGTKVIVSVVAQTFRAKNPFAIETTAKHAGLTAGYAQLFVHRQSTLCAQTVDFVTPS